MPLRRFDCVAMFRGQICWVGTRTQSGSFANSIESNQRNCQIADVVQPQETITFSLISLSFGWHGPSIRRIVSRSAGADRSGEGSALGLDCSLERTSIQSCPARVKQTLLS